jgi:hypothetical protein
MRFFSLLVLSVLAYSWKHSSLALLHCTRTWGQVVAGMDGSKIYGVMMPIVQWLEQIALHRGFKDTSITELLSRNRTHMVHTALYLFLQTRIHIYYKLQASKKPLPAYAERLTEYEYYSNGALYPSFLFSSRLPLNINEIKMK